MNNDQGLSKIFSVLLLVAAATLGWMGLKDVGILGLGDRRVSAQVPADEQDVIARLWEDPLQAIQADLSQHDGGKGSHLDSGASSSKHTVEAMAAAVSRKVGSKTLCLLIVPIPDTPFPDDLETRLRLRYSVQMALASKNFAPDNRNALGYFKLSSSPDTSPPESEMYVPYEWFNPRSKSATNVVLVLWLPESRLSRAPLDLLKRLQDLLIPSARPPLLESYPYVFIIGPRSSDTLKKMVPAEGTTRNEAHDTLKDRLSIFSPQATTPDPLIGLAPQATWAGARDDFARKLHRNLTGLTNGFGAPNSWRYFHNFIAPDDQLTDLLAAELALRGVNLHTNSADKILILTEADTQYGRSLPLALQASLDSHRSKGIHYSPNCALSSSQTTQTIASYGEKPPVDPQLVIHRYLRGLDQQKGHERNTSGATRSSAKSPEEAMAAVLTKHGAMALGESQLDYVDRLAADLQRSTATGRIKAVGVLGGDLYDKLILLQSLRSRFPAAVFFTTDLDARLWHPDHLSFTRNLVVASAYGVRVTGQNDGDGGAQADELRIPPFRDGYQVAVFKACQAALSKAVDPGTEIAPRLQPFIFELGRNGPNELKPLTGSASTGAGAALREVWNAAKSPVLPKPTPGQNKGLFLFLFGGLLIVGMVLASRKASAWGNWVRTHRWILGWVAISVVLLGTFYSATLHFAGLPGGEIWAWKQGTSIWPTEMLRLLIACSVITTFIWAWQHYLRARGNLVAKYFLNTTALPVPPREDSKSISAATLFEDYMKRAGRRRRALRVSLATIAYLLLGFGMVLLVDGDMPARPHVRGGVAQTWDMVLLLLSITCFLSLVFYVLDAVLISAELLYRLSRKDTEWPAKLLEEQRNRFDVLPKDLAGYLDVRFAADKSEETGKLILIPFIIQFLFILSRNSYFDNWTWPGTLVAIFVCNILLACAGWMILRCCAKNIRLQALEKLRDSLDESARDLRRETADAVESPARTPKPKDRHDDLLRLQKLIAEEHRGAYSHLFQDPALFAVLLPSGMYGILFVLFRALFGGL